MVADQRVEARADCERQAPAVADDSGEDAEEDVRDPAVQAPVEEADEDGLLGALVVVLEAGLAHVVRVVPRLPVRRLPVVVQRLSDPEEVEADSDAAAEEHAEPREIVKLGLLVGLAELEVAVLGAAEPEQENRPDVLRQDVQPREVLRDPRLAHHVKRRVQLVREGEKENDNEPEYRRRDERHNPVEREELVRAHVDGDPAVGTEE
mmetsp:Transcript_53357/g.157870  ORF Transcript_53357/g.157870 Transcript_53357/m.157870 type:complete len:207 (-) Transcript_53357:119-739(-)